MRFSAIFRFCVIMAGIAGLQTGSASHVSAVPLNAEAFHSSSECIPLSSCIHAVASRGFGLPPRPPPQPSNFRSQFNQRAAGILNQRSVQAGQTRQQLQPAFVRKILPPAAVVRNLQASTRLAAIQVPPGRAKSMPAVLAQAATLKGLARHEGRGTGQGGHTIALHVGLTDSELRRRLSNPSEFNPRQVKTPAASSFSTGEIATRAVAATMWGNRNKIKQWLQGNPKVGTPEVLFMQEKDRKIIGFTGRGISIGDTDIKDKTGAIVVLHYHGSGKYVIHTSYPAE